MGVSLVGVGVKLDTLSCWPCSVIILGSSDFCLLGRPSENSSVEIIPSTSDTGSAEISIDDQVSLVAVRNKLDVINGDSVAIT